MASGFFISFEGIDKSGKSTQAQLLVEHLRQAGRNVVLTHEPGGTHMGQEIRRLVLHTQSPLDATTEMLLFAADRAHHVATLIRPALAKGKVVITDRYIDSTLAYQGYGRALNLDRLRAVQQIATGGLMPDLTVWVDVDLATARARLAHEIADRMESEDDAHFERVRAGYAALCESEPGRFLKVDGVLSVEAIFDVIRTTVDARLPSEPSARGNVQNRV